MQKKNTPTVLVRKSIYDDLRVSVPCALLAGQSITAYHQKENFFELFLLRPYYPAILFSMLMAWIIFYVINRVDRYLQKILPWDRQPTLRLMVQGVLCSLFPLVLDFIALAAYYSIAYEKSVYKSVFFRFYLFPIFLYTVMINMYYNCRYIAMAQGFIVIDPNEQLEHGDTSESVRLEADRKRNDEISTYAEENDIAYITVKGGMYLAKNSLGVDRHWKRQHYHFWTGFTSGTILQSIPKLPG